MTGTPHPGAAAHGRLYFTRVRLAAGSAGLTLLLAAAAPAVDAQTTPPTADVGLGRGVTVKASDDSASLNIRARIQTRATIVDNPRGTRRQPKRRALASAITCTGTT